MQAQSRHGVAPMACRQPETNLVVEFRYHKLMTSIDNAINITCGREAIRWSLRVPRKGKRKGKGRRKRRSSKERGRGRGAQQAAGACYTHLRETSHHVPPWSIHPLNCKAVSPMTQGVALVACCEWSQEPPDL